MLSLVLVLLAVLFVLVRRFAALQQRFVAMPQADRGVRVVRAVRGVIPLWRILLSLFLPEVRGGAR